jgi:hypothetical protein
MRTRSCHTRLVDHVDNFARRYELRFLDVGCLPLAASIAIIPVSQAILAGEVTSVLDQRNPGVRQTTACRYTIRFSVNVLSHKSVR